MRIFKFHPLAGLVNSYLIDSPQPSNINYAWNGGSLLGLCLVTQLATGIFLAMHYIGSAELAFISVEGIMRDVWGGAMIRYIHANTASLFFAVIYLHIARGFWYGSYRSPRTMTWNIGVIIFILLMGTAFMGYQYSPKWIYQENDYIHVSLFFFFSYMPRTIRFKYKAFYSTDMNSLSNQSKVVEEFIFEHNLSPVHIYENLENPEIKDKVRKDCKQLSGVYLILNKVTLDFYIGSASTGRFYSRFMNHLFYYYGSKIVKLAVQKYKIKNFAFIILEVMNEVTNKENNKQLLDLEDFYLKSLLPNYNILTEAGNSYGYKHTEMTRIKMKEIYSKERREWIRNLNLGKSIKESTKELMRSKALNREPRIFSLCPLSKGPLKGIKALLKIKNNSKSIIVYNLNGTIYGEYPSMVETASVLNCGVKTIYRALRKEKKLVKRQWLVELKKA
jgi:group I intron endonuclease